MLTGFLAFEFVGIIEFPTIVPDRLSWKYCGESVLLPASSLSETIFEKENVPSLEGCKLGCPFLNNGDFASTLVAGMIYFLWQVGVFISSEC
jgi:hypothetical protein